LIDLFFGDESHFCSEGYVPRGWQFADEEVSIDVEKGFKINALALISRSVKCVWETTTANINSAFVIKFLDGFAETIQKETFIVLDNASIHKSKLMQAQMAKWQEKGLYIFFLPPYHPEFNIAETLWRILKTLEIRPKDYDTVESLDQRLSERLDSIAQKWTIEFSDFKHK
jgi:transposase